MHRPFPLRCSSTSGAAKAFVVEQNQVWSGQDYIDEYGTIVIYTPLAEGATLIFAAKETTETAS
jgi:hypothetical protein